MQAFLDRLEVVSKILLICATLAAGSWAVLEYIDKKKETQVAETLGYARRLSSDPLLAAQSRIGMAWYAVRDSVRALETTHVASAEEFAKRKRQLVMMVVDKTVVPSSSTTHTGLVSDLDLLIGFFAELQVCIDAGLCDRVIATSYFQPYAKRLYCVHEPFIEWKSSSFSKGYGGELWKFALRGGETCP